MVGEGLGSKNKDSGLSTLSIMEELVQAIQAFIIDVNKRLLAVEQGLCSARGDYDELICTVGKKKAKIAMLLRYNGDFLKLTTWLAQCCAYFNYYDSQFDEESDKTIFAGALLNGIPAMWF